MNILMIGGTGCLSSAVVAEALKQGLKVTIITRGRRPVRPEVESIVQDCFNYEAIEKVLGSRQFDAVIDYLCYTDEQLKRSFELYSKHTRQYIFISSCAVYNTALGKKCNEESPKVLPIWDYSVNKWKSEELLMQLAAQSNCNYTVIRPCVTYGSTRIPYGISPVYGYHWTLAARVLAGKPIIRWNRGVNRCNMTRVEDFAVGVVGLIGNPAAKNEAFNVCGDEAPSFNDVLDALSAAVGVKAKTIDIDSEFYANEIPWRRGELLGGRCIDAINANDKLKAAVPAFRQTMLLKEGVAKTIQEYKEQNYEYGIDWKFDADTDRIIRKWCKSKGVSTKGMNLGFVDYLGTATLRDRWHYLQIVYRGRLFMRMLNFAHRVANKLLMRG